jgi:hypothetical protein
VPGTYDDPGILSIVAPNVTHTNVRQLVHNPPRMLLNSKKHFSFDPVRCLVLCCSLMDVRALTSA